MPAFSQLDRGRIVQASWQERTEKTFPLMHLDLILRACESKCISFHSHLLGFDSLASSQDFYLLKIPDSHLSYLFFFSWFITYDAIRVLLECMYSSVANEPNGKCLSKYQATSYYCNESLVLMSQYTFTNLTYIHHQFVNNYVATVNVFLTHFLISLQVHPIAITGAIKVNK